ncbi:MAG: chitobiase/beta-hexosaminidase C-terminal domain-containing protein [Clostridia bacterium]|nr:chitobiase/beta-hexosaminidase C-terminal domain-containing protein [Clostridia bacterium]
MLCPKCGYYAEKEETVCPECGEILNTGTDAPYSGAEAIRQGKRARQAIHEAAERTMEIKRRRRSGASRATVEMPALKDEKEDEESFPDYRVSEAEIAGEDGEGVVFERRRRTVYDENDDIREQARAYTEWIEKGGGKRLKMVNWMRLTIAGIVLVALIVTGSWLFLNKTEGGQKVMARLGKEATSAAMWAVGEDLMNNGDIDGAIESFEKAMKQDEAEEHVDVDGMLMLGSAYEAAGHTEDAARLYQHIYEGTPSRPEAYVNHIRILLNNGKLADAGNLMKTAYEKTGETTFQTQRRDLLPEAPEVDKVGGFFEYKIAVNLSSNQGYDVYYTFEDENTVKLPQDGIRFTKKIELDEEGTWTLRAVAVNGELVSDEIKGTYKIIMPSPQMPQVNLAPGAYKTRKKVILRPGKENEKDDDIRIFYTVDGSNPNTDSPEFTGEPVLLPTGHKVTIKAIAVNRYEKESSIQEVSYKIEVKPYPLSAWEIDETVSGLELNKTTMQAFQAEYGAGQEVEIETTKNSGFKTALRKFEYPWGYAVMNLNKKTWVLVELHFTDKSTFKAPRDTGIGDPKDYVIGKFRDMGQVESASGNRGLYHLDNLSDGKFLAKDKSIRYRIRVDGTWRQLKYYLDENDKVKEIEYRYIPK